MTAASDFVDVPRPAAAPSRRREPAARAMLSLARARLRSQTGARAALWLGVLLAVGGGIAMIVAMMAERTEGLRETVLAIARASAWLCGGAVALSAANARHVADRREGAESLVLLRGGSARALESARVLAAILEVFFAVAIPAIAVAVAGIAFAGSLSGAAQGLRATIAVLSFAIGVGVVVGGLAAACGRHGGGRGRGLLAVAVFGPWVLLDMVGAAAWSIPGALDALLGILGGK